MARAIGVTVFVAYAVNVLVFVINSDASAGEIVLCCAYLLVFIAFMLFAFWQDTGFPPLLTYLVIAAQTALAYLPLVQFSDAWISVSGLLAVTVLLLLPPVAAWPAFAVVILSGGWIEWDITGSGTEAAYILVANFNGALALYGLTLLARRTIELHAARTELAMSAVAHERLRFARDLHDLLGLSLSAIAPKGELAYRLIAKAPERARRELSEIMNIARRALADVRSVARGYRELNLDEASRTAESVLAASAVDVRMELNHGELPSPTRTLLATVLREGVTNVLLHSRAERCEIILQQSGDTVSLDIVNDGIDAEDVPESAGEGLAKLTRSVAEAGGTLGAGLDSDGRFRLHMTAPVAAPTAGDDDTEPLDRTSRLHSNLAWALAMVVFCGLSVSSILRLALLTSDLAQLALGIGCVLGVVAVQLLYFCRPNTRLHSPRSYAMWLAQAGLSALPLAFYATPWVAAHGFAAGSALLVLRSVAGWPVFVAVVVAVGTVQAAFRTSLVGLNAVSVIIGGLAVFGLTWMVRARAELRAARVQLAKAAVAEERLRFARDLHDLLGLSLSAIALKSELAHRLAIADPERAGEQLTEILSIARLALADVPAVAAGNRELSLADEFESAQSLLSAVDVDVRMDVEQFAEVPDRVGTVLATVLREGVTNVLRHSKGDWCEISVRSGDGAVVLDILNNGVIEAPELTRGGNGIYNLSARVTTIGGELIAGLESEGTFRLKAVVPV